MKDLVMIFLIAQAYGHLLAGKIVTSADSVPTVVIDAADCVCKFCGCGPRPDYQLSPGIGYHKLHTEAKTWNEAGRICFKEGGHLAIINSAIEALILRDMLSTATNIIGAENKDWVYVGIHDFFKEGDWTTVFGEPLASTGYDRWLNNEPNHVGNNKHCGAFAKRGGLLSLNCNQAYAFFCEMPITR